MKLLDDLRAILKGDEADPWKDYDPDAPPKPQVTDEQIQKAVEQIGKPKSRPRLLTALNQGFVLLWGLGHFIILYVMIGSPISGGILFYVLVDLIIFSHYFWLLNKERKKR
jgi:hypothetical protein